MSATPLFEIQDLHVRAVGDSAGAGGGAAVNGGEILRGVDLTIGAGEVHALMGPNGSGKSTLANTLLGNPDYEITQGRILFRGDDISDWDTDVRGKAGVFLAFQYPQTVPGVSVINFLRQALSARKGIDLSVLELRLAIMEWMQRLDMDPSFADRYLNEGFSGGEKKRNEILQMAILEPEVAVLDETDSGLDIDALKVVAQGVRSLVGPEMGALVITHYQRILSHIQPDYVHVFVDGRIVEEGGPELADKLEAEGYEAFTPAKEAAA
jgi:Fe-S cluster assembly ATP-binding protein